MKSEDEDEEVKGDDPIYTDVKQVVIRDKFTKESF